MPADYEALKAELLKPSYLVLSHQAAADAINAPITLDHDHLVPIGLIQQAAFDRDRLAAIEAAAGAGNPAAQATVWLWSSSRRDFPPINTAHPKFQAALAGLVASTVITQDDADFIGSLSSRTSTVAREIDGWGLPATIDDVIRARSI